MIGSCTIKTIKLSSLAIAAFWLVFSYELFAQQGDSAYLHIPDTISKEAQAFLWQMPDPNLLPPLPGPDEFDEWKVAQQAAEKRNLENQKGLVARLQPTLTKRDFGGVPVLDIKPRNWKNNGKVLIYTHGGAYTFQSAASTLASSAVVADRTGLRVISVDYTFAPHSRWRETIQQVLTVFAELEKEGYAMSDIDLTDDEVENLVRRSYQYVGHVQREQQAGRARRRVVRSRRTRCTKHNTQHFPIRPRVIDRETKPLTPNDQSSTLTYNF